MKTISNAPENTTAEAPAERSGIAGLVTIVIPVFNRLEYVPRAIESALGQTYGRIQVIVVDDGSTIDPWPAIAPFEGQIEFIRKPNGGLSTARNAGIRRARGEFILFLDDDDYLEPRAVEVLVGALREHPGFVWSAGRFHYFDDDGSRTPGKSSLHFESGDIYERMVFECLISCPSSVLLRTDALRDAGLFDESLRLSEDYDMWLTLSRDHPIAATAEAVTNYRIHARQISRTQWARHFETHLRVVAKHRLRARPHSESVFDRSIAHLHLEYGDNLYIAGDMVAARAHWRQSIRAGNPRAWPSLAGRTIKSFLPPSILDALRAVTRAGRQWARHRPRSSARRGPVV